MSEVTSVSEWKKDSQVKATPLPLPSGKTALVRRPGMQVFLNRGMIPNSLLEVIGPIMEQAQKKPGAVTDKKIDAELNVMGEKMLQDPAKIKEMLDLVDAVTVFCVVQPPVHQTPENFEDREDDLLYVDEVDETDKMFIFNYAVGGSGDLEPFRKATSTRVGSGQPRQKIQRTAKSAARH